MSASTLLYPCRECGRQPVEATTVHGRKRMAMVECANRACKLAPVAIGDTREEAQRRWNDANRQERPIW